ncbi:MAG: DUF2185 domain-containing protein [Pseudomonadota bacterium]|jgi:hypothetical protein
MPPKVFRISAAEIRQLIPPMGSCIATDRIVVDGSLVGYCYREEPDNEIDSGWRFFAGDEDDLYVEDPNNMAMYDVNTIANYDEEIISVLAFPPGAAFERDADGRLVQVAFPTHGEA